MLFSAALRTFLILLFAATAAFAKSPWTVRYATFPALTNEQLRDGLVPNWPIQLPETLDGEIRLSEDNDGRAIGYVLLGIPLQISASPTASLAIALEYTAPSSRPARTATIDAVGMTASA